MYININRNQPVVEKFYLPFSPQSMGDSYLAVSTGRYAAPQTGILLETSIQAEQCEENVKVIWRPTAQDPNTYLAEMCGYGNESGMMGYDVPKADLSEETENRICEVLDHIVLYQEDRELVAKINERVKLHIENNSTDGKDCYQEVLQIINDYYGLH